MVGAPGLVRFGVSGVDISGGLFRELLESVSVEEDLHKGLVGMGVPDVTISTLKLVEVARTLDLTSVVTLGVTNSYGESIGTEACREGIARHVALMACDGSSAVVAFDQFLLGCRHGYGASVGPHLTRMSTWR
ncbi:hypothetical protein B296_00054042 [Ensete ventricosum]|uniref:Uncharacterized protein n=1 Tax=Ensete ventricosum TaxID=4639 RepID=A0A426Y638_ENSVE|nr:hypothetical protein B296_00054042 [Ensete ventricosum]